MNPPSSSPASPGARRVLCIDDDEDYLTILTLALRLPGVTTVTASNTEEGLQRVRESTFDLILTDIQMPGQSGFEFIRAARQLGCRTPILVLTAKGSVQSAVEALKLGARDYLTKPIDPDHLRRTVDGFLRDAGDDLVAFEGPPVPAESTSQQPVVFEGMLGASAKMLEVFDRIVRVAAIDATVLILGESGTGKELVARAIHQRSNRREGPFVPVHTGAIPRELIASELFGHERGSFTGAVSSADGKFDAAQKGTLFLDEIDTMDSGVQVALLRVLESFRFTRVGGRTEREADVRVVAATNQDITRLVKDGRFREDLFYRLNVFTIVLPPLRERLEDVAPLADHYLRRFAQRYATPPRTFSQGALERLYAHPWHGNVRELRNVMENTAIFARDEVVKAEEVQIVDMHLASPGSRESVTPPPAQVPPHQPTPAPVPVPVPFPSAQAPSPPGAFSALPELPSPGVVVPPPVAFPVTPAQPLASAAEPFPTSPPRPRAAPIAPAAQPQPLAAIARNHLGASADHVPDERLVLRFPIGTTVEAAERQLILRTLEVIGGNKQKAARILGISRRCLYNKLATYGIATAPRRNGQGDEQDEAPEGDEQDTAR